MNLQTLQEYLRAHAGPFLVRLVVALLVGVTIFFVTRITSRVVVRALQSRSGRSKTIAPLVKGMLMLLGSFIALMMALAQLGIDVTAVLAGAGVVGLAIGFGAQSLVKDCISGFFLIFDDVVETGDAVEIDGKKGVVEQVGLRVTQVRTANGDLWYIPNGAIISVGNGNRGHSRAIIDVPLAHEADLNKALSALDRIGASWAADNEAMALEPPKTEGVVAFTDRSVTVRLSVKTPAGKAGEVEGALRRRVKEVFGEEQLVIGGSLMYLKSVPVA